jgi:hypothetical protein
MARIMVGNVVKIIALSLLCGAFTLGITGCELGYEREEIGEEGEREGIVGEEEIGEGEGIEEED